MAVFNKFEPFVKALAEGKHDLGSNTLQVALCNAASEPVATYAKLSELTQIAYTNLSTQVITTSTSAQTSGVYKLVLTDLVLTASGAVAPFQYIVIFNQTATDDLLIGWYDNGSEVTLASGDTFTINFDGSNGVLQLA